MEDFLHTGPPFAGCAVGERLLARFADGPPFLSGGIGGHFRRIHGKISSGVFEITEQVMPSVVKPAQIDRVVPDIAITDHPFHVGPDGGVEFFVFIDFSGVEADDGSVAFHGLGSFLVGLNYFRALSSSWSGILAVFAHELDDVVIRLSGIQTCRPEHRR